MTLETLIPNPRGITDWRQLAEATPADWIPFDKQSDFNVVEELLPGDVISCQVRDDRMSHRVFYATVAETPGSGARPLEWPSHRFQRKTLASKFAANLVQKLGPPPEEVPPEFAIRVTQGIHDLRAIQLPFEKVCGEPWKDVNSWNLAPWTPPMVSHPCPVGPEFALLVRTLWDVRWKVCVLIPKGHRRDRFFHLLPEFIAERAALSARIHVKCDSQSSANSLSLKRRDFQRRSCGAKSLNWVESARLRVYARSPSNSPAESSAQQIETMFPLSVVAHDPEFEREVGALLPSVVPLDPQSNRWAKDKENNGRRASIRCVRDRPKFAQQRIEFTDSPAVAQVALFFNCFYRSPNPFCRPPSPPTVPVVQVFRHVSLDGLKGAESTIDVQ